MKSSGSSTAVGNRSFLSINGEMKESEIDERI